MHRQHPRLESTLYFFFFGFFFFTPPALGTCVGIELDAWAGNGLVRSCSEVGSSSGAACSPGSSFGLWFCIFCMRDRFRDSNRLRKIEELVLNLMHYNGTVSVILQQSTIRTTHCRIIGNFEHQFALRRFPFYAIAGLSNEALNDRQDHKAKKTHIIWRFRV